MQKVDWMYHRPGCKTCAKTQAFFEDNGITVDSQVTTKQRTLQSADALKLVKDVDEIYATRGTKLLHFDLKTRPGKEEIMKALLGPTGNLRAPVFRKGRALMVGFHPEAYRELFG